jgi:hypothetical protein
MDNTRKQIRYLVIFFMIVLFGSGLTAIPLEAELAFVTKFFPPGSGMGSWLDRVYMAVHEIEIHLSLPLLWLRLAGFRAFYVRDPFYRSPAGSHKK